MRNSETTHDEATTGHNAHQNRGKEYLKMQEERNQSAFPQVSSSNRERLRESILELTQKYWVSDQRVLLFSRLGSELNKSFNVKEILGATKLSEFVDAELAGKVKRVTFDGVSSASGIIPADANIGQSHEEASRHFFGDGGKKQTESPHRFDPVLWKAFGSKIEDGQSRSISIDPVIRYQDHAGGNGPYKYKISPEMIVGTDLHMPHEVRAAKIYQNIVTWLDENNISTKSALAVRSLKPSAEESGQTKLHQLIALLPAEDLRRIHMPLDVIQKLL